ncbi:unnamed protein product, partial [Ectocarpus fasciculatus]
MNGLRETVPPGPYFPFHRDETYPRTLCVNFKRLEYRTLQKYCKLHGINVRPDCSQAELAVAAARHFQEAPSVDEEGVMVSFLQKVIVPDRPFEPTIDLTLSRMGSLSVDTADLGGGGSGGGGRSAMPNAMMHDHMNDAMNDDMLDGMGGDMGGGGGGSGGRGGGVHGGNAGGGGHHGGGGGGGYGRHGGGHASAMGGGMGYDEKPRAEGYSSRGMGGGGREGGGGGGGGRG